MARGKLAPAREALERLEAFEKARICKELQQRIPEVKEIGANVAKELWDQTMQGQAWSKEKIFMAALGIALQLSRGK